MTGRVTRAGSLPVLQPGQLLSDVDLLFGCIRETHPNPFAYVTPAGFDSIEQQLRRELCTPMSAAEFYTALAPAVSSLRNGHTHVTRLRSCDPLLDRDGAVFPFSVDWDGARLFITGSYGATPLPVGAVVERVNGEPAGGVVERFARYLPAEGRDRNAWVVCREDWFWYWLRLHYGDKPSLDLVLRTCDGAPVACRVTKEPLSAVREGSPLAAPPFRATHDSRGVMVLKCDAFAAPEDFVVFLKQVFLEARQRGDRGLVVDLRRCTGGTSTAAELLLQRLAQEPFMFLSEIRTRVSSTTREWQVTHDLLRGEPVGSFHVARQTPVAPLPKAHRFAGDTAVLIGPLTYSNGHACAYALKRSAGAVLFGATTADSAFSYGGACPVDLPHSGLTVRVATQVVVCPGAERGGGPLEPDHPLVQTPEDAAEGRDTVLEAAVSHLHEKHSR